jgi:hypothetical protein
MVPSNRVEFKEYCLRTLGSPVIDINVADEQVEDRIDEALLFYQTYHHDAIEHTALIHVITQENIDDQYITIPSNIVSVVKTAYDGFTFGTGLGHNIWHGMKDIMYDIGFGTSGCNYGTSHYTSIMDYIAHLQFTFQVTATLEFHKTSHKLYTNLDWSKVAVGDVMAFEVYQIIDPTVYGDIWGDRALCEYATVLIGCQWGNNLSKFDNVELPGGITLDGNGIYDKYNTRKEQLEEEWSLKWEAPLFFEMG